MSAFLPEPFARQANGDSISLLTGPGPDHLKLPLFTRFYPAADTEPVLGEALALLFFMHRAQATMLDKICEQMATTQMFNYHFTGTISINSATKSPMFDLRGHKEGSHSRIGDPAAGLRAYAVSQFVWNGLEGGILQHNFPVTGIATPRLIEVANAAGNKIFDATSANWSSVRAQLTGWTSGSLNTMEQQVVSGKLNVSSFGKRKLSSSDMTHPSSKFGVAVAELRLFPDEGGSTAARS